MSGHLGERLSALLDGEMSPADREEAQAHLRDCAACARALEELASVDALARALPVEAPAGYFDELPARVRARVRARRRPRVAPAAVWAAAAAAVVMFAVVTPLALRRASPVMPITAQHAPAPPAALPPERQGIAPATTAPTETPDDSSALEAFDGFEAPARLRERDHAAKRVAASPPAVLSAPLGAAGRDKDAADAAAPAPPAAPPPATAPPPAARAAAAAPLRADDAVSTAQAEQKAEEAHAGYADAVTMAETRKERGAAAATRQSNLPDAEYERTLGRRLNADERYDLLLARRPTTAAAARALGKAWEAFARDLRADPRADEARVRAIESAVTAWRLGGQPADLAAARAAAREYLDVESAPQRARVRALLETLPPAAP